MNSLRKVLRYLYENPWSSADQIAEGVGISKRELSSLFKKDINASKETREMSDGKKVTFYALYEPKQKTEPAVAP